MVEVPFLPSLNQQEKVLRDKALKFLTDVLELDLSKYSTTQVTASQAPVPNGVQIHFKLATSEGKLDVVSHFSNGELTWCKLYPLETAPLYTTVPSSNVIDTAKNTLGKVNSFSAKEYLQTAQNLLNTVTELENSTIVVGEYRQIIAVSENTTKMTWEP